MDFQVTGPHFDQSSNCAALLRALPEWFGMQEAILVYEKEIDRLPTFLAVREKDLLGFLSLKQHFAHSAEVFIMAVRRDVHRCGVGRALMKAVETFAQMKGIEYLQVKTLGPSRPDVGYAGTRAFYEAMGFAPLEEFTRIWDGNNPCLVLVKRL